MLFCNRVVGDHRVNISRIDKERITRPAQALNVCIRVPVRLADNADGVAEVFHPTGNQGGAKRRMVYIGIPGYQDKV